MRLAKTLSAVERLTLSYEARQSSEEHNEVDRTE